MDGNDFIALAGRLVVARTADEASYRTAVSRAYYGAFHIARSFLLELGFRPVRNANVHAFVRQYLHGSGISNACTAAEELADLQAARNRADYDLEDDRGRSRNFAMVCVEQSHRIVAALEVCRQDANRDGLRHAIAEYERKLRPR